MENKIPMINIVWVDKNNEAKKTGREKIIEKSFKGKIPTFYFSDPVKAQNFIATTDANSRIFLITSGSFGYDLMKEIHDVDILISVLVYCFDVEKNKQWAVEFPKVVCVEKEVNTIMSVLTSNILLSLL